MNRIGSNDGDIGSMTVTLVPMAVILEPMTVILGPMAAILAAPAEIVVRAKDARRPGPDLLTYVFYVTYYVAISRTLDAQTKTS